MRTVNTRSELDIILWHYRADMYMCVSLGHTENGWYTQIGKCGVNLIWQWFTMWAGFGETNNE